jgi:hypothetical protein
MANKSRNEQLAGYVDSAEGVNETQESVTIAAQPISTQQQFTQTAQQYGSDQQIPLSELPSSKFRPQTQQQTMYNNPLSAENRAQRVEDRLNRLGYHEIDIKTLPTAGLFYSDDTKISIRAAKGEEIKHWSTMDETEIQSVEAAWSYMIEKCVQVKSEKGGNWRDIVGIDRLYLLLAIRELTFVDQENGLMVSVSDTKDIPITKEMVHYIDIPEELMRLYDPVKKCFVLRFRNGNVIDLHIPTFGVQEWLNLYVNRKGNQGIGVDADNIRYATLLIDDYRGMTDQKYADLVYRMGTWSAEEWSVISYVVDELLDVTKPMIKYKREDGVEESIQLNFRDGFKSIFTIQNPLSLLC